MENLVAVCPGKGDDLGLGQFAIPPLYHKDLLVIAGRDGDLWFVKKTRSSSAAKKGLEWRW